MDIRRTVLLADANEEFRTLVRKIIDETEEFSVVGSVGDGTEALRLAREEAPDLILMDVVLPGLDGFGVLKQLREQEGKVPKVILISAFCSDSVVSEAVDLGASYFLTKPVEEMSMEETRQQVALPTIMVVPYKSNDRSSYAGILKNDFDLRVAVSTVKEGFVKLGVKTVAAEGKQAGTLRASEWESKNADSNDKQLLMNSGADVYVIVDLRKDISAAAGSRVSLIMTARETATGIDLASRKSWTNRFRTTDVDKLCAYAAQDVLDGFLKDISKEFARRVQQGNTIVLRVSLADNAVNTMNSRINGSTTLSAYIRNWVRKNAQGGRYHIQGAVDDSLIFDSVQIPAKDGDGLPMDCITFADNLVNYLTDSGIDSEHRVDGSTIYLTIQ